MYRIPAEFGWLTCNSQLPLPPPPPVNEYSGELGQLVRVGSAHGGIVIDHQCEWESTQERRHLSPIYGERWPLARFWLSKPVLAYREGSIDFHGVDWRPIKGWCHLAELGKVVPNFLCAPSPPYGHILSNLAQNRLVKRRFFGIIFKIVSLLCTFSVPYWVAKHI